MALADLLLKPFETPTKKSSFRMALDRFVHMNIYIYIKNSAKPFENRTIWQPDKN
jgi:hypothetical protein